MLPALSPLRGREADPAKPTSIPSDVFIDVLLSIDGKAANALTDRRERPAVFANPIRDSKLDPL
jgi:hypothetical protein